VEVFVYCNFQGGMGSEHRFKEWFDLGIFDPLRIIRDPFEVEGKPCCL
jgi:hypothetical protein